MPTPLTLGQRAAAALKSARSTSGTLPWSEVARIIDSCALPKATPMENASAKATVEAIYALYPRKKAPLAAKKAIGRAIDRLKGREPDPVTYLLERTRLYSLAVAMWPQDDRQYCPYPASWFNAGSYDEDPKEWGRSAMTAAKPRDYKAI